MTWREGIQAEAKGALFTGDYARLEALAARYARDDPRTPSGWWKLRLFHRGIENALRQGRENMPAEHTQLERRIDAWRTAYPNSVAANVAYAAALVNRGWLARGDRWASETSPSQMDDLARYAGRARAALESVRARAAEDPEWFTIMFRVARAENWSPEAFSALYDLAVAQAPTYNPAYIEATIQLESRWGGSPAQLEGFVQDLVRRRHAGDGDEVYARLYTGVERNHYGYDLFARTQATWPALRASFEHLLARYPDAWNLSEFANYACMARDRTMLNELNTRGATQFGPDAWHSPEFFAECQAWANGPPVEDPLY